MLKTRRFSGIGRKIKKTYRVIYADLGVKDAETPPEAPNAQAISPKPNPEKYPIYLLIYFFSDVKINKACGSALKETI
jgi:hypothetical protein